MSLTEIFASQLRKLREAAGMSQDALAHRAGIDRTYVGQLERCLKSPTLQTVEKLSTVLEVSPAQLVRSSTAPPDADVPAANAYHIREHRELTVTRAPGSDVKISTTAMMRAVDVAHGLIDELYAYDLDVAEILGLRNLSAFVGELLASAIVRVTGGALRSNPHQDGYPDLLLMDEVGAAEWDRLEKIGSLVDKAPFSPFSGGGFEVKATCGSIPSPKQAQRRSINRPQPGEQRIDVLTGYDWKAHHRDTNNLIGLLWDFVGRRPRITALFYSSVLVIDDWGAIVQPKEGGGRTTSVSIMRSPGIRKMYDGWICVLKEGGYAEFLNHKNRGDLIPV